MISCENITLRKARERTGGKAKYIINGGEYFAEEAAIRYYETLGYKALWSENAYWWTLMSLFFWDVIFAKTRGAVTLSVGGVDVELDPRDEDFEQHFKFTVQMNGMPSDFFTPEFYERRKALIRNKIQELQNSNLEQKLIASYNQNYGKNCRPIENWDRYALDELLISVQRLDKRRLIEILERLISDFRDNRAGLPDLIVYDDKDFFFSEVKGERDRISEKQREWHDFLSTTLGLKVEILLINHSEAQIKRIRALYQGGCGEVTVSFGYSSSKKREEAIKFIQEQESYFTEGEGKEQIHGARFKINETDIEKLYRFLDLTSGWKTQRIQIDGESITSSELRDSLSCFREKVKRKASLDYCRRSDYGNKPNKFGCRSFCFHELEDERWEDYGYIDTAKGEWIFDRKRISEEIEEEINRLKHCPLFDAKKVRNLVKNIPEKVNPKIDKNWGFISNDYETWFWYRDRWLNSLGETNFPGLSVMIGVRTVTRKERNEAIRFYKADRRISVLLRECGSGEGEKAGCFIATVVYNDSEADQVKTLRSFRDTYLKKKHLGKRFVDAYYKVSPSVAKFIGRHRLLRGLARITLDVIVRIVERRLESRSGDGGITQD